MTTPILTLVASALDAAVADAKQFRLLELFGAYLGILEMTAVERDAVQHIVTFDNVAEDALMAALGSSQAQGQFREGLEALRQRPVVRQGGATGLEGDPLAIVALAVGIRSTLTSEAQARSWLLEVARSSFARERSTPRRQLLSLAEAMLDGDQNAWERAGSILRVAFADRLGLELTPEVVRAASTNVFSSPNVSHEWAVFHQAALVRILRFEATVDLVAPTIKQLGRLLRNVPASLKRWPWMSKSRKGLYTWDIANEAHVQGLLYAILRPVFNDLIDEDYVPAIGYKHPRYDLALPSLGIIIEVKYLRRSDQAALAKVTDELAADASLYLQSGSNFRGLIAFIWDETGATHHHAALNLGVMKIKGFVDSIVVSRPGTWNDECSKTGEQEE